MLPVQPTLFLLVGLPAAGKTTRARELEIEHAALRLTPDEWMIPLFGAPDPDGMRDVLEGRLIATAMRVLELGVSVVLDFGFWSRSERSALRSLARSAGASCVVVYQAIGELDQRQRVNARSAATPEQTFPIDADDLASFRSLFEVPGQDELEGSAADELPPGFLGWADWANARWPSLDAASET